MSTLKDKLIIIQQARDAIRTALAEKGQVVGKDIRDYAQAVSEITTSEDLDEVLTAQEQKLQALEEALNNKGTVPATSGVKLFETIEEMQSDENAHEGDLAVVYREALQPITSETEFDSCTFPNEVVLSEAFTDDIYGSFRSIGDSYFDGMYNLSSSIFRFDGYGDSGEIQVEYTSQDGITYNRTDGGETKIDFETTIKWEDWGEPFNIVIGNFMQISSNIFEGLYNCIKTKTIDRLPMLSTSATYYQGSEYTKDIEYLSAENTAKVLNALTIMESLQYVDKTSVATLFFDNNLAEFKVYLSTESSTSYKGNYYCAIRDGYVCATPYGYGKSSSATYVVKCFTYDMINDTYTLTDVVATYNDNFGVDFTKWYIPHTNEAYVIGNIPLSKSSSGNDTNLYIVPYNKSSGYIFNCKQNCIYKLAYVLVDSQIDAISDYVYEKTFYGKNGIEDGILANNISTAFNDVAAEIYGKAQVCYNTLTPRVLTENDKAIDTSIKIIPCKDDGTPLLDTSNITYMYKMFYNCASLITIPLLNSNNVINMSWMFADCSSLITIPLLNSSNVASMSVMFYQCTSLITIPLLNTSKVTAMQNMFEGCSSLVTIPLLDTNKVLDMDSMFANCSSLTTVPLLDTNSVTRMENMFEGCTSLTTTSLNNILAMCTNAISYTGTKTLVYIGLTQEQATICTTLSNYQAFTNAGWTTGY